MAAPKVSTTFNAVDRISKPVKGMKKSVTGFSRHTQRSFGGLSQTFSRMRGLLVGAGAAITTGAIARGISQFAQAGDEIGKTARQLGLGVEALQELRFAAERQGVSTDNLEKSFKAMNNRLGLLRNGQGQLNTLLRDTNPELREQLVNTENSEEAFMLLMDAMNEAGSAAERTALAQAAFSSSGRELVRVAEAGTDGIEALRQEARATGVVMSGEATKASEAFQDQMTNLKSTMTGLRNTALTPLIKDLTPLIEQTSAWIRENKELISLKVQEIFDGIRRAGQILVRAWESGLIPAIIAGVAAFKTLSTAVAVVQTLKAAWLAFNAVFIATPVGAIIAGIAALAGLFVILWKRSEKFRNTVKGIWETIKAIGTAGPRFLSRLFGGGGEGAAAANGGGVSPQATPMGAGAALSRQVTENRSSVDINVRDPNNRTDVRQRGRAPGVSLNIGAQGASL